MNSSSFIDPSLFVQNSTMTIVESWFIPLSIFMILCCSLMIILSTFFLLTIILDKTCHTVPMMLIANSYLSGAINGCNLLGMCVFTLQNDLKQIEYQDSLCVFRAYSLYIVGAAFNYSFLIQALYRYLIVIYPTRLFFQSFRFQILIICSTWIFGVVYPFVFLFNDQILYNVDNQICQINIHFHLTVIYMQSCIVIIPIIFIRFLYLKLIRYVRQMRRNVTAANTMIRAQRELKMIRRIVILITVLAAICFPYTIFMFMAFSNYLPKYYCRISYAFVDVSGLTTGILLFQFTDQLKASVMKRIKLRSNQTVATIT